MVVASSLSSDDARHVLEHVLVPFLQLKHFKTLEDWTDMSSWTINNKLPTSQEYEDVNRIALSLQLNSIDVVFTPLFPQARPSTWWWKLAISNTFLAASLVFGNHCEHQSRLAILHDRVQLFWTWSSTLVCQQKWSISYRSGPAHYFHRVIKYFSPLQNKRFSHLETFTSRYF